MAHQWLWPVDGATAHLHRLGGVPCMFSTVFDFHFYFGTWFLCGSYFMLPCSFFPSPLPSHSIHFTDIWVRTVCQVLIQALSIEDWLRLTGSQCFSCWHIEMYFSFLNINVHENHLSILQKCRFWFGKPGWGWKSCNSNYLLDNTPCCWSETSVLCSNNAESFSPPSSLQLLADCPPLYQWSFPISQTWHFLWSCELCSVTPT